jgi:hypothetical protein
VLATVTLLVLIALLAVWARFAWVYGRIARLPDLSRAPSPDPAPGGGAWPKLTVVVACRNEARNVRRALSSLLAQDYPSYEVVAVDDRSEDATGSILRELAAAHPALRVARVDLLPAGWLGKTHAMHQGAAGATGDWILFTDADVLFAPGALRRAVAWVECEGLGHGVALPHFIAPGWWERAFVALFGLLLLVAIRVDDLRRAGSRAYIGIGAFNLVRREAYRGIGGHERLRLEVADDLKLGLVLRRSGGRQGCADSGGLVSVRWQQGFVATMRGLLKNFFAGNDYSWRTTARTAIGLPLATTFPAAYVLWALGRGSPGTGTVAGTIVAGATCLISMTLLGASSRQFAFGRGPEGLLLPFMGPCMAGVAVASAVGATARRAIVWRGTRYALSDLKAGAVIEAQWPPDRAPG